MYVLNILFLSSVFPPDIEKQVKKLSRNTLSDAANNLQWSIIHGLIDNGVESITMFNVLPIGSFPKYYATPFIKETQHNLGKIKIINFGFCNIFFLKRILNPFHYITNLQDWVFKSSQSPTVIIAYSVSPFLLKAIKKVKLEHDFISVLVVPDLLEHNVLNKKNSIIKLYNLIVVRLLKKLFKYIDGYVFLTRYMVEKFITSKYKVIEGVSTKYGLDNRTHLSLEDGYKTIIYAGTLHERFGIKFLIDTFKLVKNPNTKLIICGVGDYQKYVESNSKIDSRIVYKGLLDREAVYDLIQSSTIVINPRNDSEVFTKYSFPSKNLEALSMGKPLIAFKLPGIPDEYDPYIIYLKSNVPIESAQQIDDILSFSQEKLDEIGRVGKEFVDKYKNRKTQAKQIIDLINDCVREVK